MEDNIVKSNMLKSILFKFVVLIVLKEKKIFKFYFQNP